MSIINDALKKAEYFRRWKTFTNPSASSHPKDRGAVGLEDEPDQAPAAFEKKPIQFDEPPLRVYFEDRHVAAPRRIKIRISKWGLSVFLAGGFLALLLGPWFYIWFNKNLTSQQTTPRAESPVSTAQVAVLDLPPVSVVESKTSPSPADSRQGAAFKEYLNPERAKPSVRPLPRTMREIKPEMLYHLTGISILSNSEKLAVINGKLIGVGERIGKAVIISIQEKEVVMERGNKKFSLILE